MECVINIQRNAMHVQEAIKLILAEQIVVYFSQVDLLSYNLLSGHHHQLT